MPVLTKETIIGDVLNVAPQAAPMFQAIGMHCLGCALPAARPLRKPARCTASMPMIPEGAQQGRCAISQHE
jgi:hypothetical protein